MLTVHRFAVCCLIVPFILVPVTTAVVVSSQLAHDRNATTPLGLGLPKRR